MLNTETRRRRVYALLRACIFLLHSHAMHTRHNTVHSKHSATTTIIVCRIVQFAIKMRVNTPHTLNYIGLLAFGLLHLRGGERCVVWVA